MDRSRSFLLQNIKPQNLSTFTCVVILGGFIIVYLLAYVAFGDSEPNSVPTLIHASIIFRHGEKTPTSTYPTSPYRDSSFWPEGWGQLTKKGKQQIFQMGQFLHMRYSKFVGPYLADTVRVQSSDHDRCLQSAAVLLAAMFPPSADQAWNPQLLWQPIPAHTTPRHLDQLITVTAPCPAYEREKQTSDSKLEDEHRSENKQLYEYLTTNSGLSVNSLLDVETLFNILEIESETGKDLPSWSLSVYPQKMINIAALVLSSFTYTAPMKRFKGGPLVKEITNNMVNVVEKGSSRKLSLYAAHDLTIVSVRRALGFDDVTFKPKLGAALIFELHSVDGEPQVRLLYLDKYATSGLRQWQIPGCPAPCSLTTFVEAVSAVSPTNWTAECYS